MRRGGRDQDRARFCHGLESVIFSKRWNSRDKRSMVSTKRGSP